MAVVNKSLPELEKLLLDMIQVERKREESLLKFKREQAGEDEAEQRTVRTQADLSDVDKIII